jgi:hypothetical protein
MDGRSRIVWNAYEKWGPFIVILTWTAAFLFGAPIALIALGTIAIYPFVGAEVRPSQALLVGLILLISTIALILEIRLRRATRARNPTPG